MKKKMETTISVHLPLFYFRALVAEVFVDVFGTIGIEEALSTWEIRAFCESIPK